MKASSWAGISICLLAGVARPGMGAPATSRPQSQALSLSMDLSDEGAMELLLDSARWLAGRKSFAFRITLHMKGEMDGLKQEMVDIYNVSASRPDHFAVRASNFGLFSSSLVYDGKDLYSHLGMLNRYTVTPATLTLKDPDAALAKAPNPFASSVMSFVTPLLSADESLEAFKALQVGRLGGEEIRGARCRKLHISAGKPYPLGFDLWIEEGGIPAPRKAHVNVSELYRSAEEALRQGAKDGTVTTQTLNMTPSASLLRDAKLEVDVFYDYWQVDSALPPDTFKFIPPAGATLAVAAPMPGGGGMMGPGMPMGGPHPLLGKAAPPFKLALLGGGQMDLESHKGKDIVILDFWATWCGPCRGAMPVIDKVAQSYAGKGVVLYAVNLMEEPKEIREFLEEMKLTSQVALDKDNKVGMDYKAEGIPQTVIIGKDGVIEAVYVGLGPSLDADLRTDLDTLLAGRKLAGSDKASTRDAGKKNVAPDTPENGKGVIAPEIGKGQAAPAQPGTPAPLR